MQTAKKSIQKKTVKFLTALFVVFAIAQLFLFPAPPKASAQTLWDSQTGMGESGSDIGEAFGQTGDKPNKDIRVIVAALIKVFLGTLGIIFIILLIIAGYKWMTAGGNEESVKDARSQISRAVIGLIIILLAWSATEFVITCVLKSSGAIYSIWYCPGI